MLVSAINYKGVMIARAYKNGEVIWHPFEYKFFDCGHETLRAPFIANCVANQDANFIADGATRTPKKYFLEIRPSVDPESLTKDDITYVDKLMIDESKIREIVFKAYLSQFHELHVSDSVIRAIRLAITEELKSSLQTSQSKVILNWPPLGSRFDVNLTASPSLSLEDKISVWIKSFADVNTSRGISFESQEIEKILGINKIYSSDSKEIENKINFVVEKFTETSVSKATWAKADLREKTQSYFLVTHSSSRPFLIKKKPVISQRAKAQSSPTDSFVIKDVLNININNNIETTRSKVFVIDKKFKIVELLKANYSNTSSALVFHLFQILNNNSINNSDSLQNKISLCERVEQKINYILSPIEKLEKHLVFRLNHNGSLNTNQSYTFFGESLENIELVDVLQTSTPCNARMLGRDSILVAPEIQTSLRRLLLVQGDNTLFSNLILQDSEVSVALGCGLGKILSSFPLQTSTGLNYSFIGKTIIRNPAPVIIDFSKPLLAFARKNNINLLLSKVRFNVPQQISGSCLGSNGSFLSADLGLNKGIIYMIFRKKNIFYNKVSLDFAAFDTGEELNQKVLLMSKSYLEFEDPIQPELAQGRSAFLGEINSLNSSFFEQLIGPISSHNRTDYVLDWTQDSQAEGKIRSQNIGYIAWSTKETSECLPVLFKTKTAVDISYTSFLQEPIFSLSAKGNFVSKALIDYVVLDTFLSSKNIIVSTSNASLALDKWLWPEYWADETSSRPEGNIFIQQVYYYSPQGDII